MTNDSNTWFRILQDLKREQYTRRDRAKRRAAGSVKREEARERASKPASGVQMGKTEWVIDEFGNMSRSVYATNEPGAQQSFPCAVCNKRGAISIDEARAGFDTCTACVPR